MKQAYLTYALSTEGKLVHISSVPNGEACGCTCPGCGSKLVAKNKGQHNQHHFAHIGGSDCVRAVESALHLMAKKNFLSIKKSCCLSFHQLLLVSENFKKLK